jgi:hypothetical protein
MNTKDIFFAIRRAYRVVHNAPISADGVIESRIAATSSMRAFTGKWDTCEPFSRSNAISSLQSSKRRTSKRNWCYSPFVAAACTRWLKKN